MDSLDNKHIQHWTCLMMDSFSNGLVWQWICLKNHWTCTMLCRFAAFSSQSKWLICCFLSFLSQLVDASSLMPLAMDQCSSFATSLFSISPHLMLFVLFLPLLQLPLVYATCVPPPLILHFLSFSTFFCSVQPICHFLSPLQQCNSFATRGLWVQNRKNDCGYLHLLMVLCPWLFFH